MKGDSHDIGNGRVAKNVFVEKILEHLEVHKRCFVKSVDNTLILVVIAVMFQKFFDLTVMHDIVHIQQHETYVVHVSAEWHITKINTKLKKFLHFSGILALSEFEGPAKPFKIFPLI